MIRLTKEFSFEMAHAIDAYEGKCRELHGHSYRLWVCVEGKKQQNDGMVLDFHILSTIVKENITENYDHSLMLQKTKENRDVIEVLKKRFQRLHIVEFIPTTENILQHFALLIKEKLPPTVRLYSLKLQETDSSFAEWFEQ